MDSWEDDSLSQSFHDDVCPSSGSEEYNETYFRRSTYSSPNESLTSEDNNSSNEDNNSDTYGGYDYDDDEEMENEGVEYEPIDLLEENNNDPNNNMDNENNDDTHTPMIVVEAPLSPQPGCSKVPDVIPNKMNNSPASNNISNNINQIAQQIFDKISKITHKSIVAALNKAQIEGNIKQISISDLLPVIQIESKHSDEKTCSVVFENITSEPVTKPLLTPLSPQRFINNVTIDLTDIDNSNIADQGENKMNKFNEVTDFFGNISPIRSTPLVEVKSNKIIEMQPSTSNKNSGAIPKTCGVQSRPVCHLPDPETNNRKVHIGEDNNAEYMKSLRIQGELIARLKEMKPTVPLSPSTSEYKRKCAEPPKINKPIACSSMHRSPSKMENYGQRVGVVNNVNIHKFIDDSKVAATVTANQQQRQPQNFSSVMTMNIMESNKKALPLINVDNPVGKNAASISNKPNQQVKEVKESTPQVIKIIKSSQVIPVGLKRYDAHVSEPKVPQLKNIPDPIQPGPSRSETGQNEKIICQEIYQKLRAMFPNLRRKYIKTFCPPNWTPGMNHDVELSQIVEKILIEEPLWMYEVEQLPNDIGVTNLGTGKNVQSIDETCEYLAGLFPDADPHYIRDTVIQFKDENALKEFINKQLQKADYPTREQYLAKLKITQEQERYTTNFVVADFVKIFPNPFQYFEDPNRKCQFNLVCFEFLKSVYNRMRVNTISRNYEKCRFNMSLTANFLKKSNDDMKNRRASRPIPTADIPILQEMAFIRHYDQIRKYIDDIELNERNEFEKLKKNGELLVCQCCYDDECMPLKCSMCENGHIFCNSCLIKGTDSKLGDGEAHVPCFLACGSEFSLSTLQNILMPTKFSILLKKRQTEEVIAAGLEGLISCPFCHFASIPPEGDKVFKCLNPECMKESCIQCKEPNHVPLRCDEVIKTDQARKYIEEKMTQALARTCYKCKRSFFKEEGCNKITCPCGAIMCYLCDKPIKDYSHFAGQGSNSTNKCPLWTDNQRLNAEAVRKVAEDARKELLRQNPALMINTDKLTPELPPPTTGPHNDIPAAQNIVVQVAARVMKENR